MQGPRAFLRLAAVAAIALSAFAVVGCTPAVQPSPTVHPDPGPSHTRQVPSPSSTPSTAPAVAIPRDCHQLVSPDSYKRTFGDTPLNDPGFVGPDGAGAVTPSAPPPGANASQILSSAVQLYCVWRDPRADITGIAVTVATVDGAVARGHLDELAAQGYTCKDVHGGRQCQKVEKDPEYPVDDGFTSFSRDDVYLSVTQSNFPTNDLIGRIVATLWP